jgi:hypothetical protein
MIFRSVSAEVQSPSSASRISGAYPGGREEHFASVGKKHNFPMDLLANKIKDRQAIG